MLRYLLIVLLLSAIVSNTNAQKDVRSYIFGHSLINHALPINPVPSQETSVPHWMHFLAESSNHSYAVGGQYGFLTQHINLPPTAQWGFENVTGAWDSDYESFVDAAFDNILITPGNFIQWQGPSVNFWNEDFSPIDATATVFDWCYEQDPELNFYIYENWPDMGPYLNNGFPPNQNEWQNYSQYLETEFHDWFLEYHDILIQQFSNSCVSMIPTGPVINELLKAPPFNTVAISEWYEDDAPHGRASIYFLAALTTYMAMYEEKPNYDYQVDPIINEVIADNLTFVIDFIWDELLSFKDANGNSRVFCSGLTRTEEIEGNHQLNMTTIATANELILSDIQHPFKFSIVSADGSISNLYTVAQDSDYQVSIAHLPKGLYFLIAHDEAGNIYRQQFIKI